MKFADKSLLLFKLHKLLKLLLSMRQGRLNMLEVNIQEVGEAWFILIGNYFLFGTGHYGNIKNLKSELSKCYETLYGDKKLDWDTIQKYIFENADKFGKNENWKDILTRIESLTKFDWQYCSKIDIYFAQVLVSQKKELPSLIKSIHPQVRYTVACGGQQLNHLIRDKNESVRAEVARQGYGLDILVADTSPEVRKAVAGQGYGLDILYKDKLVDIRKAVAMQGYKPEIMLYDKSPYVRLEVAKLGYGLDIMINDKSPKVRKFAKELIASKLKC